jgi:hypothetical protein
MELSGGALKNSENDSKGLKGELNGLDLNYEDGKC